MRLYNTLSRQIDSLKPLQEKTIKLYTCGLTVYSQPHIGNWLGYIYWDVLVRTLRAKGYHVDHTQNITDVGHLTSDDDNGEDKMEKGARREGITAWDIAAKYINIANDESTLLGILPASHLVRATEMIAAQIKFAKALEDKGYLYEISGDGMYFDTSKLDDYGKLARLDIAGLDAGARVSVEGKRTITDFAVWKFSPSCTDTRRDMEWDSPWGKGFPGWHLECSVIARETLGDQIDIHTGGIDHIPVHHTNEIAQTESLTGKQYSQLWLHVNHLKADGKKMSKSLGNTYTLHDIQKNGYSIMAFRVFALEKHYRTEGNFTFENLKAAQNRLQNWREATALRWQYDKLLKADDTIATPSFNTELLAALSDDLNTPAALRLIDRISEKTLQGSISVEQLENMINATYSLLGVDLAVPDISDEQYGLIARREKARQAKNWPESDRYRDQLTGQGIGLRDTSTGALWYPIGL